jgi:cell division protein FtsB
MASPKSRRGSRLLAGRWWFAFAVLVLVGLLYYRPLHDYYASTAQRAQKISEVITLTRQQAALKRKLAAASTPAARAAQERLLDYIRPGEHLFFVKNIPRWRRQNGPRHGHSH